MIIDLDAFLAAERPLWRELEAKLTRLEEDPGATLDLPGAERLHYLYQRASSDLARLDSFASEPETRRYLEALLVRAYGEIHAEHGRGGRFMPLKLLAGDFPRAFRRRFRPFLLTVLLTVLGIAFGALAVSIDPEAKSALLPFGHGQMDPAERVHEAEQAGREDQLSDHHQQFSAMLMEHNIRVGLFTLSLGLTWGLGSAILLFYNGVILGGLCTDYLVAGQGKFLAGWLLPHGVIEIPAILIAGQAAFVLAGALIGWGARAGLRERMRGVTGDLFALTAGFAAMLIWAGLIESFLSQYHEPVISYNLKISFGLFELLALVLFLALAGRRAASWNARGEASA